MARMQVMQEHLSAIARDPGKAAHRPRVSLADRQASGSLDRVAIPE